MLDANYLLPVNTIPFSASSFFLLLSIYLPFSLPDEDIFGDSSVYFVIIVIVCHQSVNTVPKFSFPLCQLHLQTFALFFFLSFFYFSSVRDIEFKV